MGVWRDHALDLAPPAVHQHRMARKTSSDSRRDAPSPDGPDFNRERALLTRGVWPVAGVDEVGRGPLAGPVVSAAVILNPENVPGGLDDSKKLTKAARLRLYEAIMESALHVAVASVSALEIDATDIRKASLTAMQRAIAALAQPPAYVFVDGRDRPDIPCPSEAVIGGDALVASIAAASIVAKVTRDRMMERLDALHPEYGFGRHMGYGSAAHRVAIAQHGATPFHRLSFAPFRLMVEHAAELARRRAT